MAKRRAVFVCPGRGTYNRSELGYLSRFHSARGSLIERFDRRRVALGQPTVSDLDGAASHIPALHGRGDNASPLIFTCSYADFVAIDRDEFEIVAVTGNSMGWYTALACAGSLSPEAGFDLVNAMGALMHFRGAGGQVVHTTLDEQWRPLPGQRDELLAIVAATRDLHVSIELGGMIVVAGDEMALDQFVATAPAGPGSFPLRLQNHAAFHTKFIEPLVAEARSEVPMKCFGPPGLPLVDGRGMIWRPLSTEVDALYDYTLGYQLTHTYDFTSAIGVAVKEFAPDCLIVAGPGATLGGAAIQSLLKVGWHGWTTREDAQALPPFVVSLGRADHRGIALKS